MPFWRKKKKPKFALFSIIYSSFILTNVLTTGRINTPLTSKLKNNVDLLFIRSFPGDSVVKNSPAIQEMHVLHWEDLLEKEMVTHSSITAWEIPWTEVPGRLQSMGLQRIGYNWATEHTRIIYELFLYIYKFLTFCSLKSHIIHWLL